MENKKEILSGIVFILFFLILISFISAIDNSNKENPLQGISNKGIKYDKEILDNFNLTDIEKDYFVKGDLKKIPKKEIEWGYITVDIKDTTNIPIPNRNSLDFESMLQQRNKIMIEKTDAVLSTLSKDEFQLKMKSEFGGFFAGNITKEGFEKLLNDERVKKVYAKKEFSLSLFESGPLINANDVWADYNGTGQTICVIDTGVDYTSSDLGGCFGSGCKVKAGYDYINDDSNPMDDNGHGTLVAGVIISQDNLYRGIAYGADIVALKAVDSNANPDENAIKSSLQWCLNNAGNYGVSVVSMSLGKYQLLEGCLEDSLDEEIEDLYNAGITLVAGAGNDGEVTKIRYPACNDQVISVGATYDKNIGEKTNCRLSGPFGSCLLSCTDETTYADKIVCSSNRDPSLDLLAPGCEVISIDNLGCGTSMSTPMVAGAAALLLEKKPDLDPIWIKGILQATGEEVGSWKRIDVEAALDSFCVCDDWSYDACGTGGCGPLGRLKTRDCHPSACDDESECFYDESCVEEESEVNDCTESGYEFCIESSYGDCDVSIASNMYENVNDIQWGAVNDAWDPYVIGEYTIGWKDVDAEQMYYNCDGDTDCEYGGCDCYEVPDEDTIATINAPGTAHREEILGYDDTINNACWVWWYPFNPNYGQDNPIYVLNCFNDSHCSSNQYCDKSGNWDDWDCVSDKSNGQSCTSDFQCLSGYCDDDGIGLNDDGWCFTPYNAYFDGQETSYCEYSTGNGDIDCDERQAGTDLNKCLGISFYEEECSATCESQDITSVFECDETDCSCSQPLCDGLTSGDNITTCSGGETYFADNCTSSAEGQDRDNICRSSSFESGCTADAECNGVIAGTGNCNSTCNYVPPTDPHKFYIYNSSGNPVAWLGDLGNILLKGNCYSGGSCDNPGPDSFIIRNSTGENVAYLNSTGDLCITNGDCSDESENCNFPSGNSFIVRNEFHSNMIYLDSTGDLCLTGELYENIEL